MKLIRWSLLVLCAAAGGAQAQQEIKVGGIFDLTGITSDVGKPFAQGVRDGVQWTNENGGINGKKIRLVGVGYGHKIPEGGAADKRQGGGGKGNHIKRGGPRRPRGPQGPGKPGQTP